MNHSASVSLVDPALMFHDWLESLDAVVGARDGQAFAAMFDADCYWKDLLALTWEYRTFCGRAAIGDAFEAAAGAMGIRNVRIAANRAAPCHVHRSGKLVIEGYFDFETSAGTGVGFARLLHDPTDPGRPRTWQLLTALHHLHGFEERIGPNRPTGEKYSKIDAPESWRQDREREIAFADRNPEVVIIGAGQGGLMLAARLRQMGADVLVVEKTARVGDVWRTRYNNLTLHNEITANNFPYMPFPDNWPMWLPKDMLADWLESYATFQELNVWTGTELVASAFDDRARVWRLTLRRADGTERTLETRQLVAAMGISGGRPKKPRIPGLSGFRGTVLHSGEFTSGMPWKGKRAIVIGTGNSGHDIAQDLYVSGATVSMVQRGATCVVSLEPSATISYSIYDGSRSVEDVDLMVAAIPYPILIDTYQWITRKTNELDKDLLARLSAAGFKHWTGEDGTGFQLLYLRGAGGYYIDVGCCELIADRKIALLQAGDSDRFVPEGLRMQDGTVIPADLVVLATGFDGMQDGIRRLLGDEVADRVGPVWGFDEDFNMRNLWKRTAQDGFWIMGGAIIEARLFSRFLALQIKASLLGLI